MTNLLLLSYYAGLLVFALNGILLVQMRSRQIALLAQEDRLRRLLIRKKR